jgi:hypothetical protein
MSRIDDDYEPNSIEDELRMWAFWSNQKRAIAGKKGRKFLLELEAALVALPEKRLANGVMAASEEEWTPKQVVVATGDVCALGAVAAARAVAAGEPRHEALQKLAEEFDPSEAGWTLTKQAGDHLKICHPLAYAVVECNDEGGGSRETPEKRYERVLAWVREKLKVTE